MWVIPRDKFPGAGFGGVPTRLQWRLRGCGVVGGMMTPRNLRRAQATPRLERQGILGFLHHETASFKGAPEKRRDQCHVTQPRARFNVSCSRADHK